MHLELLVPGLLASPQVPRLPALELLLRRGRAKRGDASSMETWLADAFGLSALPAGALSVLGEGGDAAGAPWVRADPVHLRLLRDRVVIVPAEALDVTAEEAEALGKALQAHFAGRMEVRVHAPTRWSARLEQPVDVPALSPLDVAGRAAAPGGGADALLTEIQMVLHAHEVNAQREARGLPAINSVWLWGAGEAPSASARWQSLTSDDPLVHGLARAAGLRSHGPSSGEDWLGRSPGEGRHLVVLDVLRPAAALGDGAALAEALEALERDWFAPVLAALRDGRLGMATIHAPDGERSLSVETIRGDLRRIWRRPRPLATWID